MLGVVVGAAACASSLVHLARVPRPSSSARSRVELTAREFARVCLVGSVLPLLGGGCWTRKVKQPLLLLLTVNDLTGCCSCEEFYVLGETRRGTHSSPGSSARRGPGTAQCGAVRCGAVPDQALPRLRLCRGGSRASSAAGFPNPRALFAWQGSGTLPASPTACTSQEGGDRVRGHRVRVALSSPGQGRGLGSGLGAPLHHQAQPTHHGRLGNRAHHCGVPARPVCALLHIKVHYARLALAVAQRVWPSVPVDV